MAGIDRSHKMSRGAALLRRSLPGRKKILDLVFLSFAVNLLHNVDYKWHFQSVPSHHDLRPNPLRSRFAFFILCSWPRRCGLLLAALNARCTATLEAYPSHRLSCSDLRSSGSTAAHPVHRVHVRPASRLIPANAMSTHGVRRAAQPPPGARCTFNFVVLFTVDFFIL